MSRPTRSIGASNSRTPIGGVFLVRVKTLGSSIGNVASISHAVSQKPEGAPTEAATDRVTLRILAIHGPVE
jgi:hypothetical protein